MKKLKHHTLTIKDLLERPIIRNDKMFEWMNKMSDEELQIWYDEENRMSSQKQKKDLYHIMSREIDTDILYNLFKMKSSVRSV